MNVKKILIMYFLINLISFSNENDVYNYSIVEQEDPSYEIEDREERDNRIYIERDSIKAINDTRDEVEKSHNSDSVDKLNLSEKNADLLEEVKRSIEKLNKE